MAAIPPANVLDAAVFVRELTLTEDQRKAIVDHLWPSQQASGENISSFEGYFSYYIGQCQGEDEQSHAIRTHQDIVNIIAHICGNVNTTKTDLLASISAAYPNLQTDQDRLSNSIELAVRLWLMMNITTRSSGEGSDTVATKLPWASSSTLPEVILRFFTAGNVNYVANKKRFPKILTSNNLKKIGGFQIERTDNLLDHLSLEGQTILFYHHASALKCIKESVTK